MEHRPNPLGLFHISFWEIFHKRGSGNPFKKKRKENLEHVGGIFSVTFKSKSPPRDFGLTKLLPNPVESEVKLSFPPWEAFRASLYSSSGSDRIAATKVSTRQKPLFTSPLLLYNSLSSSLVFKGGLLLSRLTKPVMTLDSFYSEEADWWHKTAWEGYWLEFFKRDLKSQRRSSGVARLTCRWRQTKKKLKVLD